MISGDNKSGWEKLKMSNLWPNAFVKVQRKPEAWNKHVPYYESEATSSDYTAHPSGWFPGCWSWTQAMLYFQMWKKNADSPPLICGYKECKLQKWLSYTFVLKFLRHWELFTTKIEIELFLLYIVIGDRIPLHYCLERHKNFTPAVDKSLLQGTVKVKSIGLSFSAKELMLLWEI